MIRRIVRHPRWIAVCAAIVALGLALSTHRLVRPTIAATPSQQFEGAAAPVYGVRIPSGYRNWMLISVAVLGSPVNDIRAKLGNDLAVRAFKSGKVPFPDGAIIARLAWKPVTSEDFNKAFELGGRADGLTPAAIQKLLQTSFVAGPPTNVQFMIKDSRKYASTGGWGFAQFNNGNPAGAAVQNTCWSCHAPFKATDFVFTRYAP
jgi:Cytochrome P460